MKLYVNEDVLKKYNLSISEFLILYLGNEDTNLKECTQSLIDKELIHKDLYSDGKIVLSDNTKKLLLSIIVESDAKVIDKDKEFIELAEKLREIYPKGRKEGTTYMWRGTVTEIAKKLKTLVAKYNCKFTQEQAIKATKEYVKSFNGNYTKMRLLKYFILKLDKDADNNVNFISELMSLIENEEDINTVNTDWTSFIV